MHSMHGDSHWSLSNDSRNDSLFGCKFIMSHTELMSHKFIIRIQNDAVGHSGSDSVISSELLSLKTFQSADSAEVLLQNTGI